MPGPGPHTIYALGSGLGLMGVSNGRFSPQHCIIYATNAFLGPDLGSFSEWLTSTLGVAQSLGSTVMDSIHHPFYYIFILGLPLCFFYSWISGFCIQKGVLDSFSGVPLSKMQCLLLVSAGSLSHFFLDHLFETMTVNTKHGQRIQRLYNDILYENSGTVPLVGFPFTKPIDYHCTVSVKENGHSSMYTWILSTGWWETRAPVNPDSVFVVGFLCTCLFGGFIYINRVKQKKSIRRQLSQSVNLLVTVASLYCLWCACQKYWRNPPQAAVGEEADLGVLVFLAIYFFLPHSLCIMSMNSTDFRNTIDQLPH